METYTIGLIPSPDLPEKIVRKIIDQLRRNLQREVDGQIDWQFEIKVDSFIGAAEYVNECVDKAISLKENRGWNYAICLTDLPSISEHKVVIADVNTKRGAALLSLPSFGSFPLKKRIRKALTYITELLHERAREEQKEDTETHINWRFLFSNIERVIPEEDHESADVRYVIKSRVFGWLRILSGMVFANRPWLALPTFKRILTLAFATGTYISIFSTPWELSVVYTLPRFVVLMLLSIFGMVIWVTFAHNLWEKESSKSQNQYRRLYNVTTIMTLLVITFINYLVLFCLFMIGISLFVPGELFEAWTDIQTDHSFKHFIQLSWFITSVGMLAGAVGATVEKEERIRHVTYSYRQLNRYYEMKQEASENNTEEDHHQSYGGTRQTHKESDSS